MKTTTYIGRNQGGGYCYSPLGTMWEMKQAETRRVGPLCKDL